MNSVQPHSFGDLVSFFFFFFSTSNQISTNPTKPKPIASSAIIRHPTQKAPKSVGPHFPPLLLQRNPACCSSHHTPANGPSSPSQTNRLVAGPNAASAWRNRHAHTTRFLNPGSASLSLLSQPSHLFLHPSLRPSSRTAQLAISAFPLPRCPLRIQAPLWSRPACNGYCTALLLLFFLFLELRRISALVSLGRPGGPISQTAATLGVAADLPSRPTASFCLRAFARHSCLHATVLFLSHLVDVDNLIPIITAQQPSSSATPIYTFQRCRGLDESSPALPDNPTWPSRVLCAPQQAVFNIHLVTSTTCPCSPTLTGASPRSSTCKYSDQSERQPERR